MEVFDYHQVICHSGEFRAGDVFGVALCRLINPKIKIILTNRVEEAVQMAQNIDEKAVVFNSETTLKSYKGFEQLWYNFGNRVCPDEKTKTRITQTFVLPLLKPNVLTETIERLNTTPESLTSESVAFHRAMNVAMMLLKAQIGWEVVCDE